MKTRRIGECRLRRERVRRSAAPGARRISYEHAALKCLYLARISLDPAGMGWQRRTGRWKADLNAVGMPPKFGSAQSGANSQQSVPPLTQLDARVLGALRDGSRPECAFLRLGGEAVQGRVARCSQELRRRVCMRGEQTVPFVGPVGLPGFVTRTCGRVGRGPAVSDHGGAPRAGWAGLAEVAVEVDGDLQGSGG